MMTRWAAVAGMALVSVGCGARQMDVGQESRRGEQVMVSAGGTTQMAGTTQTAEVKRFRVELQERAVTRENAWMVFVSQDGKRMLAGATLVDVGTEKTRAIKVRTDGVMSPVAMSQDGKWVASTVGGRRGERGQDEWWGVMLTNAETGEEVWTAEIVDSGMLRLEFDAKGTRLGVVSYGKTYVLDVKSGDMLKNNAAGDVRTTAFSPDGTCFAQVGMWHPPGKEGVDALEMKADAASFWEQVTVISCETGKPIKTFEPFQGVVEGIAWSSDGRWILLNGRDEAKAIEVATGKVKRYALDQGMALLSGTPVIQGRYMLVTRDRRGMFLDLETGRTVPVKMPAVEANEGFVMLRGISGDGKTVAVQRNLWKEGTTLHVGKLVAEWE